jgi:hypothetical protein
MIAAAVVVIVVVTAATDLVHYITSERSCPMMASSVWSVCNTDDVTRIFSVPFRASESSASRRRRSNRRCSYVNRFGSTLFRVRDRFCNMSLSQGVGLAPRGGVDPLGTEFSPRDENSPLCSPSKVEPTHIFLGGQRLLCLSSTLVLHFF